MCAATALSCATASQPRTTRVGVTDEPPLCAHAVPESSCVRCHPALIGGFKARGDWCPEHDLPETQCLACHPDMKFAALPPLPDGADMQFISTMGEDVAALAGHAVPGKVTVFDFYAAWCVSCRDLELRLHELVTTRSDVAVRKLNVMTWDSPVATRYLKTVPALPYVLVYDKTGVQVAAISGLKLQALDDAIARAAQ